MSALVGVHNSGNAAESAHAGLARHSFEKLDHDSVGLCQDELYHLGDLLGVELRDALGVGGQDVHEVFQRTLSSLMVPDLLIIKVVVLVKIKACKMGSGRRLSKQVLLDALRLSEHLFLICSDVLAPADLVSLLADAAPLLGFLGLECDGPLMAPCALQVELWLVLAILVKVEVTLIVVSALGHSIIDQVAVMTEPHSLQNAELGVATLANLLCSMLLIALSHLLRSRRLVFFGIKEFSAMMSMMIDRIHRIMLILICSNLGGLGMGWGSCTLTDNRAAVALMLDGMSSYAVINLVN